MGYAIWFTEAPIFVSLCLFLGVLSPQGPSFMADADAFFKAFRYFVKLFCWLLLAFFLSTSYTTLRHSTTKWQAILPSRRDCNFDQHLRAFRGWQQLARDQFRLISSGPLLP